MKAQAFPCGIMLCLLLWIFTEPRFVPDSFSRRVPPDVVHEPVEDLHVAVDGDVHLLPSLGVHGQVLGEVTHLFDEQISGTREVLLQVLCLVTDMDDHVGTVGRKVYIYHRSNETT